MVISNSVVNFCLRLPEILVFISSTSSIFKNNAVHTVSNDGKDLDKTGNFNSLLVDFSDLTFIMTFSTNFGMYYLFNTKFKLSVSIVVKCQTKIGQVSRSFTIKRDWFMHWDSEAQQQLSVNDLTEVEDYFLVCESISRHSNGQIACEKRKLCSALLNERFLFFIEITQNMLFF